MATDAFADNYSDDYSETEASTLAQAARVFAGWTKLQIVTDAFGEIALAGHVFDLEPEELQQGARRLEMMLANWETRGVTLRYAYDSNPSAIELDAVSGLPDYAIEPVVLNLAKRIAAAFGKALSQQQMQDARDSFNALLKAAAFPPQMQLPSGMPRGAGAKPWRTLRPFFNAPSSTPLSVSDGGDLDILRG